MKKITLFLIILVGYFSCKSSIVINKDTNKDGRIDTILYYAKKDKNKKILEKVEKDLNYNSKFERNLYFKNNEIEKIEKDENEDGKIDWVVYYKNKKITTIEKMDSKKNIVIRRLEKIDNKRKKVYLDQDKDGIFDHITFFYNDNIVRILSDNNKDGIFEKERKLSSDADYFAVRKKAVVKKIIKPKMPKVLKLLVLPFRNLTRNAKVDYLKIKFQNKFNLYWKDKSKVQSSTSPKSKKYILKNNKGNNYILDGSFIYYRKKLRIIMKILDTKTGRIIASKSIKNVSLDSINNDLKDGVNRLAESLK